MRMVLINDEGEIHIENDDRKKVHFMNFADLKRCSGIDISNFAGKQVTYEPHRKLYSIDDGADCVHQPGKDKVLDGLIANVETLQTRKDNPLYGLSGQELIDKQAELDAMDAYNSAVDEIHQEQEAAGVRTYTPAQVKNYIDNQIAGCANDSEKIDVLVAIIKKMVVFILRPDPPEIG